MLKVLLGVINDRLSHLITPPDPIHICTRGGAVRIPLRNLSYEELLPPKLVAFATTAHQYGIANWLRWYGRRGQAAFGIRRGAPRDSRAALATVWASSAAVRVCQPAPALQGAALSICRGGCAAVCE